MTTTDARKKRGQTVKRLLLGFSGLCVVALGLFLLPHLTAQPPGNGPAGGPGSEGDLDSAPRLRTSFGPGGFGPGGPGGLGLEVLVVCLRCRWLM